MENLEYFRFCDEAKKEIPGLFVIAFTIARGMDQDKFCEWFLNHQQWVQIGVHGYDHENPPEQERDNARELVEKSVEILSPFLPLKYLYRPPGFQRTICTEPMLKELGFAGIAYRTRIKFFDGHYIEKFINMHCSDRYANPVTQWRHILYP